VEVPGEALQVAADDLRRAMDEGPSLRQQLMNYVQALLVQNAQTVLCSARHRLEQRLTRLLLLAHDRVEDDAIALTHEFLAMMGGARRAGITTALERLEQDGAIRRRRGVVEIVDRVRLEHWTCECYRVIAAEYRRLIDFYRLV
jgi:CRP-like cAMP-binding protein